MIIIPNILYNKNKDFLTFILFFKTFYIYLQYGKIIFKANFMQSH